MSWVYKPHPVKGYEATGYGENCPIVREQIAEKLGRIGGKVFRDRHRCEIILKKEKD